LGSDVPYLVGAKLGSPYAMVSGFGDALTPVPLRQQIRMVLIFPPFGCSTRRVYGEFDTLVEPTKRADEARAGAVTKLRHLLPDAPFNDLTEAACRVQPRLGELIDKLRSALDMPVHVTGTGSALFIIRPREVDIDALAARVTDITVLPAVATGTI
jgi:4-diphosphocytidyl-2C-methyl-D-erythritol kinase